MTLKEARKGLGPELPGRSPVLEELLPLEEMARELDAEPGWLRAQVEAGLIPAVWRNGKPWFRRTIVKRIVADWEAELTNPCDSPDTGILRPLPTVRSCADADPAGPGDPGPEPRVTSGEQSTLHARRGPEASPWPVTI